MSIDVTHPVAELVTAHPPEGARESWATLLRELEALERDVLVHVHLENHVLAPRLEQRGAS